ncbi:hypothetical protein [Vibrio rotiferianus]|uniref:hypothetical protein n=1 Tax=Vibrio rotiferianus TaxID=190895 RepID=UPI0038B28233
MPVLWKLSRVESLLHRPYLESLLNELAFVVSVVANLDFDSIESNGVRLKLEYGSSLTTLEKAVAEMLRILTFCVFLNRQRFALGTDSARRDAREGTL